MCLHTNDKQNLAPSMICTIHQGSPKPQMTCRHLWLSVRCSNYLHLMPHQNSQTYDTCSYTRLVEQSHQSCDGYMWVQFPPKSWDFSFQINLKTIAYIHTWGPSLPSAPGIPTGPTSPWSPPSPSGPRGPKSPGAPFSPSGPCGPGYPLSPSGPAGPGRPGSPALPSLPASP